MSKTVNAPKQEMSLRELDTTANKYTLAALSATGRFERAVLLAEGMTELKRLTEPLVQTWMPLQGTPLGFITDKDREGGYPAKTVQECLIEAVLRGVYPVGNEFNIIAGRCYITKNGYARLVREFPGLTGLKIIPEPPRTVGNGAGAIVKCVATWQLSGKPDRLEREIPVRMDKYSGADQILGKATRKMLAAVYGVLTGSEPPPDGEAGEPAELPATSRTQEVLGRLQGETPPQKISLSQTEEVRRLSKVLDLTDDGTLEYARGVGIEGPILAATRDQADALIRALRAEVEAAAAEREPANA